MDERKKHKCDFCGEVKPTEGFDGTLGHHIYAYGECLKERTGNRTKEDAEKNLCE